jgi:hypothetical protein
MVTIATCVVAVLLLTAVAVWTVSARQYKACVWLLPVVASLFFGTAFASNRCSASLRLSEIKDAIDRGLVVDCETVFRAYRDHPELKSDGYIRIFPGSQEFDSLPVSIQDFDPVYVTIEENPFGSNRPLNVGLCKNGFGGFHMGIRVFQTAPDIPASSHRKPITETIYLWIDKT